MTSPHNPIASVTLLLCVGACTGTDPPPASEESVLWREAAGPDVDEIVAKAERHMEELNRCLAIDSPAIPRSQAVEADVDAILARFRALTGAEKECASAFVKDYQDAIFMQCEQHGCGENIGGGCYHIANFSLHTAVFAAALKHCGV